MDNPFSTSCNPITIVTGLARSGTSMVMNMMKAGGLEVVVDQDDRYDIDNPNGYFEYRMVSKLPDDVSWLKEVKGKAVKVFANMMYHLSIDHKYNVIYVKRDLREILASQKTMLEHRGKASDIDVSDADALRILSHQRQELEDWLERQSHMWSITLEYSDIVSDPLTNSRRLCLFLNRDLEIRSMSDVVDSSLYRNRNSRHID